MTKINLEIKFSGETNGKCKLEIFAGHIIQLKAILGLVVEGTKSPLFANADKGTLELNETIRKHFEDGIGRLNAIEFLRGLPLEFWTKTD